MSMLMCPGLYCFALGLRYTSVFRYVTFVRYSCYCILSPKPNATTLRGAEGAACGPGVAAPVGGPERIVFFEMRSIFYVH